MNTEENILILPPCSSLRGKKGGPYKVVRMMKEAIKFSKYNKFKFLEEDINVPEKKVFNLTMKYKFLKKSGLYMVSRMIAKWVILFFRYNNIIKKYDRIVCHLPHMSFFLLMMYPKKKTVTVYHGQGGMYQEFIDLDEIRESIVLKKFSEYVETFVYKNSYRIGFPSKGAAETLVHSNPHLHSIINLDNVKILYNGIDCDLIDNEDSQWNISEILYSEKIIFATIANLHFAKGVDRIPRFLGELKKRNVDFQWIIIGGGERADDLLKQIDVNNIKSDTVWIREFTEHNKIISILKHSDFYIMLHRKSIFDITTLEAMYCRNLPVLTRVGGNIETNLEDNILFVDYEEDVARILDVIQNPEILEKLKDSNREVVKKHFLTKQFINNYENIF